MAKKVFFGLVLAAFAAGSLAALPDFSLSAGAGGYIGGDFGGGIKLEGGGQEYAIKMPYFGGGGYVFLDATYAELSFGFFGGGGNAKSDIPGVPFDTDIGITNLNLGLLGKYPFAVGEKLSVFPLLGIDYQIAVAVKQDGKKVDDIPGFGGSSVDFSALWFKFGGGLDYAVTSNIFARCEALYGLRLPSKFEKDLKDDFSGNPGVDVKTRLGHGITVKLAAGYRF
jgi:opacity protein-like surface antigen